VESHKATTTVAHDGTRSYQSVFPTYNLLTLLTRLMPTGNRHTTRPKRLRFLPFRTVGKVVLHTRRTLLRLAGALPYALLTRIRDKIACPATT